MKTVRIDARHDHRRKRRNAVDLDAYLKRILNEVESGGLASLSSLN